MSNTVQYPTMATVKDAAAKFGISEYFLRNLCRAGNKGTRQARRNRPYCAEEEAPATIKYLSF